MQTTPRKEIRLPREEYVGRKIYFITICCQDRLPIFKHVVRAKIAVEALRRISVSQKFLVHAFCIMPNHVHLLLEGTSAGADVVRFVARWKQFTGYAFREQLPPRFWQRRFHDYVLRKADESDAVAWYIWMNPVRKGIVVGPEQYPFSGSFTVEWPKVAHPEKEWVPSWKNVRARF